MRIAAFMPITNPLRRGDTFIEAIKTHLYWADELVIVDGGSTDGSLEAIRSIGDNRIRIIQREWPQTNWNWKEFAKAWNAGLEAANGDWVAAGETDHIFHEKEAKRIREELERETKKGKIVVKCQKLQCADVESWQSKSQMYYFVFKGKYPQIRYGFDPHHETDLAHPIWWCGENYEDIPQGEAIVEGGRFSDQIGGTGANLYNYLWTFKTFEQVVAERTKSSGALNRFTGFTEIYHKKLSDGTEEEIRQAI